MAAMAEAGGPMKTNAGVRAGLGEFGVFAQKTVAGMDSVRRGGGGRRRECVRC